MGISEDVVHETFLKAVRHKDWLASIDIKYAFMYIRTTCINLCIDYLRRKNLIQFVELEEKYLSNCSTYILDENFIELDTMMCYINMLSGVERETMILKYVGEFTNKEIGYIYKVPENTITQRLLRGRKKLRMILSEKKT